MSRQPGPSPWLLLLLLLLPAVALAGHHQEAEDADVDAEHENKDVSSSDGHSLVFDLTSLSVLAALKIKFVVVLVIAVAVFVLLTKGYNTKCLFGNCRPSYSTYGYYPYVDYTYMGYELPAGATYRQPVGHALAVVDPNNAPLVAVAPVGPVGHVGPAKDSPHLSDLTARVWNSIDIAGMAFSALNIREDDCRRKLVCQADRAAASNPLLRAALSWFSTSLARYRTDRSRADLGDEGGGGGAEWRQEDPCEELYPRCLHRDLPPALGGPDPPHVYLEPHTYHHHHHLQHPHPLLGESHEALTLAEPVALAEPMAMLATPWHPTEYRHEYRYEYPASPPEAAVFPSSSPGAAFLEGVAPTPALTATSYSTASAAASSPASATVLAPVRAGGLLALNNVSTAAVGESQTPTLAAEAVTSAAWSTQGSPEPRNPAAASRLDKVPGHGHGHGHSLVAPAPGLASGATASLKHAREPLVWRRVLFGDNKPHSD